MDEQLGMKRNETVVDDGDKTKIEKAGRDAYEIVELHARTPIQDISPIVPIETEVSMVD